MRRLVLTLLCLLVPVLALMGMRGNEINKVVCEKPTYDEDMLWSIDSLSLEDNSLAISGYLAKKGEGQWYPQSNKAVWLIDIDNNMYQLSTSEVNIGGIENYDDGQRYAYSGFSCSVSLQSLLSRSSSSYTILLVYELRGDLFAVDTGIQLIRQDGSFVISPEKK